MKMLFFLLGMAILLLSCQKEASIDFSKNKESSIFMLCDSLKYAIGDTMRLEGTVRSRDIDSNHFKIYIKGCVPLCPTNLPESFKQNGLKIFFSAVLLPIPNEVRLDCASVELIDIKRLDN